MNIGITDLTEWLRLRTIPSSTKIKTKPNRLRPGLAYLNAS